MAVQEMYVSSPLSSTVHFLRIGDKSKSLSLKILCVKANTVVTSHLNLESGTLSTFYFPIIEHLIFTNKYWKLDAFIK